MPLVRNKHLICDGLKILNEVTIDNYFLLPNIKDIIDQLGKSKYFTAIDWAIEFKTIKIGEADKDKTTFSMAHPCLQ